MKNSFYKIGSVVTFVVLTQLIGGYSLAHSSDDSSKAKGKYQKRIEKTQSENELCAEAHNKIEVGVEGNMEAILDRMGQLAPISSIEINRNVDLVINLFDRKLTPFYDSDNSSDTFKNSYDKTYGSVYLNAKAIKDRVNNQPVNGYSNNNTDNYVELSYDIHRLLWGLVKYYFTDCMKK